MWTSRIASSRRRARYVNAGYAKPRIYSFGMPRECRCADAGAPMPVPVPAPVRARWGRTLGKFLDNGCAGGARRYVGTICKPVAVRNIPKLNGKRLFGTRLRTFVRACATVLLSRDAKDAAWNFRIRCWIWHLFFRRFSSSCICFFSYFYGISFVSERIISSCWFSFRFILSWRMAETILNCGEREIYKYT